MKPCLGQASPFQSDPCPMPLYSGLRFSSIISCRLSSSLFPTRPFRLLRDLWQLRFHSFTSRSQTLRPVKARRREEEPVKEEGDEGNGRVLVKDKSGSEGRILPAELHKEATNAYMAYAMSVLLGRALPDVCDGLKPVHRRIL